MSFQSLADTLFMANNFPLYVDTDNQYLGNTVGDDGKGRLHTYIANTALEPIPVTATVVIPPGIATSANQTNGAQKTQIVDGSGNVIGSTSNALDVYVTGGVALTVNIDHTTDNILIYGNDGTTDQKILTDNTGKILIGNFPASQVVTQGTSPWVISGTVAATQSGTWTTGRTWNLSSGSDSVSAVQSGSWVVDQGTSPWVTSISGSVAVTQSTSPWVISGTVTANQGGTWNINNITGTITLPTGASTSALQTTGNASLSSIDGKLPTTLGQKTSANSLAVVLASDQSSIPVAATQSGAWTVSVSGSVAVTQSTSPWVVSGTVTSNQGTSPWVVSGTVAATQSGTWTTGRTWTLASGTDSVSVVQSTTPWVSNVSQFGGNNVVTGTGVSGIGIPRVTVSNDSNILATQSGTWNINNITGTVSLPTGASTETTLAALNAKFNSLGQKTMANSAPVVIASDQSAIPASQSGTWTVQQGTPPWSVVGNVASGSSDSGNPVKIGGVFNTTPPTLTTGQRSDIQVSSRGSLQIAGTSATGVAPLNAPVYVSGIDGGGLKRGLLTDTRGAPVVTELFTHAHLAGAATTTVKSGAGFLKRISINRTANGTATIYDNITATGTPIINLAATNGTSPTTLEYGFNFTTGLTIVTTGASLDLSVLYL